MIVVSEYEVKVDDESFSPVAHIKLRCFLEPLQDQAAILGEDESDRLLGQALRQAMVEFRNKTK